MPNSQSSLIYSLRPSAKDLAPITLNLYDAEMYAAAVVVQQLVGNLVYFSNNGRYEPRIAESWKRTSPNEWVFKLKSGFVCENGEPITAIGFKKSLERSIRYLSKDNPPPIFEKLAGYKEAISKEKEFTGIIADGNELKFRFTSPIRDGLVQILSFAPYGYICRENLNDQGAWKDDTKFISSGPYRVKEISIGKKYTLEKRTEWPTTEKKSPEIIYINHEFPKVENRDIPTIVDDKVKSEEIPSNYNSFPLIPEYLAPIILGNFQHGFFRDNERRIRLRAAIEEARKSIPADRSNVIQSQYFFPSQKYEIANYVSESDQSVPSEPLVIEGKEPSSQTVNGFKWEILKEALNNLGWPYKFSGNETSWQEISNPNYDIRLMNPSIGGGFEAWGISYLFCSELGGNLPDPSGRICKLVSEFDQDKFDESELAANVFQSLSEDSAVLPIGHIGLTWHVSPGIKMSSLSPLISVIRFDDVELEP